MEKEKNVSSKTKQLRETNKLLKEQLIKKFTKNNVGERTITIKKNERN